MIFLVERRIGRASKEVGETVSEFRKQVLTFISTAFGLVAALMWKDAIVAWLEQISLPQDSPTMLTVSAIIVTLIAVVCVVLLAKILGKPKPK